MLSYIRFKQALFVFLLFFIHLAAIAQKTKAPCKDQSFVELLNQPNKWSKKCAQTLINQARKEKNNDKLINYWSELTEHVLHAAELDSVELYIDSILSLNGIKNNKIAMASVFNWLGQKYFYKSQTDSALYYFSKAKDHFLLVGDSSQYYGMLNNISVVYAEKALQGNRQISNFIMQDVDIILHHAKLVGVAI